MPSPMDAKRVTSHRISQQMSTTAPLYSADITRSSVHLSHMLKSSPRSPDVAHMRSFYRPSSRQATDRRRARFVEQVIVDDDVMPDAEEDDDILNSGFICQ
jgi:hypothetical protein